jgi:tetratricopeptide (TPR) repeat protein
MNRIVVVSAAAVFAAVITALVTTWSGLYSAPSSADPPPGTQEPPPSDPRLSVNTLVREDIFAGFIEDDMERFSRGERSIQLLLEQRPEERTTLLAWKGGAALYRAVRALENNRAEEFRDNYRQALDLFSEAGKLGPDDLEVDAVTGGTYVVFADRLPEEYRAAAWSRAYDSYRRLWTRQGAVVTELPTHLRGELLGGLAQSAQRTGRSREADEYLDKILALLPDTPYEPIAKQWKKEPEAAARTSIACLTCHGPRPPRRPEGRTGQGVTAHGAAFPPPNIKLTGRGGARSYEHRIS